MGDEIDIYYFEDDMRIVHVTGPDYYLIILPIVGVVVIVVGSLMIFNKKTQKFFLGTNYVVQ
ncbi:MAG: hypothetical protein IJA65_01590 [Acholeplasmatales bacterium]|nr:hypothetical protein [Acholeplasmatales bacterium]